MINRLSALAVLMLNFGGYSTARSLPELTEQTELTHRDFTQSGRTSELDAPVLSGNRLTDETMYVDVLAPDQQPCVCTNLGGVSVVCEACDNERVDLCHTHDQDCQEAARRGGIREHQTFFCTTDAE